MKNLIATNPITPYPLAGLDLKKLAKFHDMPSLKSGKKINGDYLHFSEGLQDSSITWSGKNLDGFYSTALLTGKTKNAIRLVPNVKSKVNLASLDFGSVLQADGCTLSASGQYTLDQKTLEVCDLGFKVPFCIKDWEGLYLSELMRAGSNLDDNFPNGVMDYCLMQLAMHISAEIEQLIMKGATDGSPATLCDGFQKKFLADSAVVDVAVDGTKLHGATTVVAELTRMYAALPDTLLNQVDANGNSKFKFFLNLKTIRALRLAMYAAHPALILENQSISIDNFLGIPIIPTPGLGDYKAVLCDPFNLWYGTDLDSDTEEIIMVKDPLNPKQHYAIGSMKVGWNYGVGAEIVYYN